MKAKTFTLFLLLVLSTSTFSLAQNYQGFRSDRIAYFLNENTGAYLSIRVDSIDYETDSVFYFMPFVLHDSNCMNMNGSWLGKKMKLDEDGNHFFYNYDDYPVLIKSQAILNEEWIAYECEQYQVWAKVIQWETESFLGQTDMVKTVEFQAKNHQGEPVNCPANNLQVKLSENFGFIKTLNFHNFPDNYYSTRFFFEFKALDLKGITNPDLGLKNLTWQDIHNHQPGDELHVEYTYYDSYALQNFKTITLFLERNMDADTIVYTAMVRTQHYSWYNNQTSPLTITTDTVFIRIRPDHCMNTLPGEFATSGCEFDIMEMTSYYGKKIKSTPGYYWFYSVIDENGCLFEAHLDGGPMYSEYREGLGGPYYEASFILGSSRLLKYYKKDGIEHGTPFIITNLNETQPTASCHLIQQPGQGSFSVLLEHSHLPAQMRIISLSGQVIDKAELNALNWIYANPLKLNGIYLLEVYNQNRTLLREKVVLF